MEKRKGFAVILLLLLLLNGSCPASATSPAKMASGFFSNALSLLLKRLWSLTSPSKTVVTGRPLMKFEGGYTVETVFDGSKLGIDPFSVEVSSSDDELLVLDSVNSNIHRMYMPLSRYSRPKLVAGSAEGYAGHVDGRPREARMNHPKGFTMDDSGNIYVADTMNMAIRKISDTGVTTIAGGKWNREHVDGPSEDAKFSDDFEVVYIGSSCSLLVVDRGNQAIREIHLHFDDCAYQYRTGFPLGIAVLLAAGFFGYMLALLQRRVGMIVSSNNELKSPVEISISPSSYQKPRKTSVRPPLIPTEEEPEKQEEGLSTSMGKLLSGARSSSADILGAVFSGFRKNPENQNHNQTQYHHQQQWRQNSWPVQESFSIHDEDEPPPPEARTPTTRTTYAFMSKDAEKINQPRQGRAYFNQWYGDPLQWQTHHQHQRQHQQYSSGPQTYYEQSCETRNEIVFGAVQEPDTRHRTMEIKAVNYGDPIYDQHGPCLRVNYNGYNNDY